MVKSEREIDITFNAKIEACEAVVDATGSAAGLDGSLVDWVINNYGQDYWCWCADRMINCGNAYSMMSERLGEIGCY